MNSKLSFQVPFLLGREFMCTQVPLEHKQTKQKDNKPMKTSILIAFTITTAATQASLTLIGNAPCNLPGNLVTNGSFENGSPGPGNNLANQRLWATGTTQNLLPFEAWSRDDGGCRGGTQVTASRRNRTDDARAPDTGRFPSNPPRNF
jgi:hypothetical protein